jgi:hypothetical protein
MDVTKFHTVKNITETRIALTIFQSTKDKKWLNHLKLLVL